MKDILFVFAVMILCAFNSSFAQNTYQTATLVPFEDYGTCGDLVLDKVDLNPATASAYDAPDCMDLSFAEARDMWYKVVVPDGVNELSCHLFNSNVIPFPGSQEPSVPGLAVYDGSGDDALILLECFSPVVVDSVVNAEIRWGEITGLTSGDTLYLRVWDQNNSAQKIFLSVSERVDFPENYCETATSIGDGVCNILSTGTNFTAPDECGWNVTDNPAFYHFTVSESAPQPVSIVLSNIQAYSFDDSQQNELQLAVYSWNGTDCADLGGSPYSDPPNTSGVYQGCASGSEEIVFSKNLTPGEYMLVIDSYSSLNGKSSHVADLSFGTSSIADIKENSISVFPNPSTGELFIQADSYSQCDVYDQAGRLIGSYHTEKGCIHLKPLNTGFYTLKFLNDKGYEIRRVVVK